jgi:beta-lactamase class A
MGIGRRRGVRGAAAIALIASLLAACGAPSSTASTAASRAAGPSAAASSPAPSPAASSIADSPAGRRLAWVLDQLNGGASQLTVGAVGDIFAPWFLAQIPAAQLIATLRQAAASGPYTLSAYTRTADGTGAQARFTASLASLDVFINVDADSPNLISGLVFKAAVPTSGTTSWSDIDTALAGLASEHSLFAAELNGGACQPVHALNAAQTLAIGSSFKLYVLGELATQIAAGKAAWSEQLVIRDEWKSGGSGTMQGEAAGTVHTLDQYATQMISISDNTAADHLIHRLGREAVEGNLAAMGLANPDRDIPFLTTNEAFVLKATKDAALLQQYLAADVAGRRRLLDGPVATTSVDVADFADWTSPRDIDTIEWFASTSDLCGAMSALRDLATRPGLSQVQDILAVNPGITVDKSAWPYVGYKGGSEPGVLQLTWLLRRPDDRWFVLSMTLDDPASAADHTLQAVGLAGSAMSLLAEVP